MSKLIKSTRVLPEDIVVDILVQLPIKSITRFKCVCKSWYNLIQSPNFISMHFNYTDNIVLIKHAHVVNSNGHIPKYLSVFSFHSNDKSLTTLAPILEIPHFDAHLSEVLGPCNGIICITDYSRIVLCNPATREFKLLPPSSYRSSDQILCCNKGTGFGVDSDSVDCDFKVVRILRILDKNDISRYPGYRAELYSLRANSWRQLDYVLPYIEYCRSFEIFFNGACHWYACNHKYIILSFNVHSELFEEIDIPSNYLPMTGQSECLQILNGSLAFVAYTSDVILSNQNYIDIWAMKEYGVAESWLKMFHVKLFDIRYPLSIWMDNFLFLENHLGQLELCELDSPYREKFQISGVHGSMRVLVYEKTLISINK
ncbi:hypothetical protein LIER_21735 [Lithospermum erythrorhizon]|uniref:F-box domain-containing protein n=1 Tax=Lithospermum erythrorhizon TaxID=34254 RepID=A0AAV3QTN0_LITER